MAGSTCARERLQWARDQAGNLKQLLVFASSFSKRPYSGARQPTVVQWVVQGVRQRSGGAEAVEKIDPIRWLGEYLFRHNPRYDSTGTTGDPRLRVALQAFARERAEASKDEKK